MGKIAKNWVKMGKKSMKKLVKNYGPSWGNIFSRMFLTNGSDSFFFDKSIPSDEIQLQILFIRNKTTFHIKGCLADCPDRSVKKWHLMSSTITESFRTFLFFFNFPNGKSGKVY